MLSTECSIKTGSHITKSAWDNRVSSIYIRPEMPHFTPASTDMQYVIMAIATVSTDGQIIITRTRCRMSPSLISALQSLHTFKAMPPKLPMVQGDRFTFITS